MGAVVVARVLPLLLAVITVCASAGLTPTPGRAEALRPTSWGTLAPTSFGVSPPLRDLAPLAASPAEALPLLDLLVGHDGVAGPTDPDPLLQGALGTASMPAPIANFDGPPNLCSCLPPAPTMDVGRDHVFVTTNLHFAIYDRSGTLLLGPLPNNTIWAGVGGPCQDNNAGFPFVLYDQLADRWLISQVSGNSAPFGLCIAVSTTGDPTGSWYRWWFSTGNNYLFAPKWGLWPDAYYVGAAEFANLTTFAGAGVYAFERADLLSGEPTPTALGTVVPPGSSPYEIGRSLLPADLDGLLSPPAGSPGLFLGTMDDGASLGAPQDALTLWRFHADFETPSNSTFKLAATLPTSSFDSIFPCTGVRGCIPQAGTTAKLDFVSSNQDLMNRVSYRNLGTHESIVANHSVEASTGLAGIRWYELRDPNGVPSIHQQGTYAPGVSDGIHRWMAGIAMDTQGNIALGYSVSNASMYPGIRYTGRLSSDPPGSMPQGEGTIIGGGGSQTATSGRWGDYTTMAIDPEDDCTFWYVNEYYASTSLASWRTRVASFKFPSCTGPVDVEEQAHKADRTQLHIGGPARGSASIAFTLAGGGQRRVQLDIFDVGGRRLRRLVDAVLPAGRHERAWDATDDAGRIVGAGVYFARLRAGDDADSGTILLLK